MRTGRPSIYTLEIASRICNELMDGKSLRAICAAKGMPTKTTVMRWLIEKEEFRDQYSVAREMQADCFMDEQIDIADSATTENWQVKKFQADNFQSDGGSYPQNYPHLPPTVNGA